MLLTIATAFCVVGSAYMAAYHWRRRNTADNARMAAGLEVVATGLLLFLFVSRIV
jgi:hypothetical protein